MRGMASARRVESYDTPMLLDAWKSVRCPLVGMLHLPPLPGSPRGPNCGWRRFAITCSAMPRPCAGGIDGLMLENYGDVPFTAGRVALSIRSRHDLAGRAKCGESIRKLPLGINVLRNDGLVGPGDRARGRRELHSRQRAGRRRLTDQGIIQGIAHDLLRERTRIGAERREDSGRCRCQALRPARAAAAGRRSGRPG